MKRLAFFALFAIALIGAVIWAFAAGPTSTEEPKARIGLMTSLPIYWGESAGLEDMISDQQQAHWARTKLEEDFELVLLDTLANPVTTAPNKTLAGLDRLILAQPAALPPADLVALDYWVRAGGKLLLFADPMLTEHSEFGLGDKRRPQDIAMLGPILTRWGLQQYYDAEQSVEQRSVMIGGANLLVNKPGQLEVMQAEKIQCRVEAGGVVAECAIENGRVIIVSDAALLEKDATMPASKEALETLIVRAFGSK